VRPLKSTSLLFAGLGLLAVSHPAYAQDDDNEIITTGIRQAYLGNFAPFETPQSNQILDSELLANAGILTLDDALDLSASVSRQNNFGGLWNSFAIRGFPGDINLPSGFLVNGFNAGRGFSGPRDIVGIESVEVLKGPRGALFGRGEPGGTINLVTKRPEFRTGGYLQGTIGSWEQYRAEADVQQTISGEGGDLGFRLVGFYEDAESFREGLETERQGFYPSVTLNIDNGPILTYELEYTEQEIPQDRGVIFSPEFGFSPRRVFTGENVPIETRVVGHQFEVGHDFNENWSFLAGIGYRETSLEGGAFENQFGSRQTFFRDGRTVSRFFRDRDFESDYFSIRGEVSGEFDTAGLRHRLIFGADYDEFDNTQVIDRDRPNARGPVVDGVRQDLTFDGRPLSQATPQEFADFLLLDTQNPVLGNFLINDLRPNTDRNEVVEGFGFYIQDQIDITDKLQIRIGGRFDDFDQSITNFLVDPSLPSASDARSFTRFSPQVGAVYLVNDGLSIYGSYGEGFRAQTGVDFQGNILDANLTESLEFGLKAELGNLSSAVDGLLTIAVFDINQSNVLVNDERDLAPGVGFAVRPAGEASSRGVEVDANLTFFDSLDVWLSYAYIDAQFETGGPDDSGFGNIIEPGDPLINVPSHQFNIQLSKDFSVSDIDARLGGGLLYVDDQNGFVGTDFTLPDYVTVRAFAEIEPIENIRLRFDVDNIFNETFFTNSFADVWVQPGAPRRFRVSATYNF